MRNLPIFDIFICNQSPIAFITLPSHGSFLFPLSLCQLMLDHPLPWMPFLPCSDWAASLCNAPHPSRPDPSCPGASAWYELLSEVEKPVQGVVPDNGDCGGVDSFSSCSAPNQWSVTGQTARQSEAGRSQCKPVANGGRLQKSPFWNEVEKKAFEALNISHC